MVDAQVRDLVSPLLRLLRCSSWRRKGSCFDHLSSPALLDQVIEVAGNFPQSQASRFHGSRKVCNFEPSCFRTPRLPVDVVKISKNFVPRSVMGVKHCGYQIEPFYLNSLRAVLASESTVPPLHHFYFLRVCANIVGRAEGLGPSTVRLQIECSST